MFDVFWPVPSRTTFLRKLAPDGRSRSRQPGDWYPAVAARSRRYLVSTSIAKQPEREIRPVISVSLLLRPFLRRFSFTLLFFPLSLSLSPSLPPLLPL